MGLCFDFDKSTRDSFPGSVPIMAKNLLEKNLIVAALDEPEAARLAFYSHAARSPENLLYADEANFSGVGICKQLEFRDKFYQARLRRHRTAGFLFACTL